MPPTAEDGATLERALRRLPLFPLPDVVLLPHALLGLHVFEERYRALVDSLVGFAAQVPTTAAAAEPAWSQAWTPSQTR